MERPVFLTDLTWPAGSIHQVLQADEGGPMVLIAARVEIQRVNEGAQSRGFLPVNPRHQKRSILCLT